MAITLANLRIRFKRRIRAELAQASLVVADVHEDSIDGWANEFAHRVIDTFLPPLPGEIASQHCTHFTPLVVTAGSLTFASGSVAFPATYYRTLAVTVTTSYSDINGDTIAVTNRKAQLMHDVDKFRLLDDANFLLTPTQRNPVVLIADKAYVKPTAITAGKMDYIKVHPTITVSQDTVFDDTGDDLLLSFMLEHYYDFIEEPSMVEKVMVERKGILGGA